MFRHVIGQQISVKLKARSLATGSLADVLEITPDRIADHRGYFSETYNAAKWFHHGITSTFVQDNESLSLQSGTVRGLHFQSGPFAQAKLVRALMGAVYDVAVDIRQGSPSYGKHVACTLTASSGNQLYIPIGFAHGFCTLEPETIILYKVSAPYKKEYDLGLLWSDPSLSIPWPVSPRNAVLSEKDSRQPLLAELPRHFVYQ